MTLLRNTKAPVHGPGGLFWEHFKHEIEVAADLAAELLRIPDGGFVEVNSVKAVKAEVSPAPANAVTEPAPVKQPISEKTPAKK